MDTVYITWQRTSPQFNRHPAPPPEWFTCPQCKAKPLNCIIDELLSGTELPPDKSGIIVTIVSFMYLLNVCNVQLLFVFIMFLQGKTLQLVCVNEKKLKQ